MQARNTSNSGRPRGPDVAPSFRKDRPVAPRPVPAHLPVASNGLGPGNGPATGTAGPHSAAGGRTSLTAAQKSAGWLRCTLGAGQAPCERHSRRQCPATDRPAGIAATPRTTGGHASQCSQRLVSALRRDALPWNRGTIASGSTYATHSHGAPPRPPTPPPAGIGCPGGAAPADALPPGACRRGQGLSSALRPCPRALLGHARVLRAPLLEAVPVVALGGCDRWITGRSTPMVPRMQLTVTTGSRSQHTRKKCHTPDMGHRSGLT
eukprot:CAMPEP_0206000310 /NCGR_PEP_ID=MMETSP1464-20131121/1390_1 /ASSEMBLY_ACC=CAM_ASM_001124 /TAXON_ID=119497 /ORGANISM="Exanthemachrysis gayraliae, Strain RCC1523" /LENGTH=264 /DNA_ID=CAMNT_0053373565 /DNA_START=72 /DNA_END=863 /DNA_ORIENTATION=+